MMKKNGFSLVEIMIGVGILAAASLGIMKMMEIQNKNSLTTVSNDAIHSLYEEMKIYLGKTESCKKSFDGKKFDHSSIPISEIFKTDGTPKYSVGDSFENNSISIKSIILKNLDIDDPTQTAYLEGTASLNVGFKRLKDVYGAKVVIKKINLFVFMDSSRNILNCNSQSANFSEKVALIMKAAINPIKTDPAQVPSSKATATKEEAKVVVEEKIEEKKIEEKKVETLSPQDEMKKFQESMMDPGTPIEEQMETLERLINDNKELEGYRGILEQMKKNMKLIDDANSQLDQD